jgi:dihydrofolate reductase
MRISLIAAMDRHGLIGDGSGLPWHLPRDMRYFRRQTWGKPIIMGRRTFESVGKPLPGRLNIVLTHDAGYSAPGCRVARTLQEGLAIAEDYLASCGGDEIMIVGGAKVYEDAIQCWDRCYLTIVEGRFAGSTYFPLCELLRQSWLPVRAAEIHPADEKNLYPHSFHIIERAREAAARPSSLETDLSSHDNVGPAKLDLAAILARGTVGS